MDQEEKEKFIPVYITRREAQIIETVRRLEYGKAIVYKQDGKPVRVEVVESRMLKENGDGVNLKIKE